MVTELGKFLRKLRIDCGEVLFDMAGKLGVSPAFLSAVENGKKRMPSKWNELLPSVYSLSDTMRSAFTDAVADSEKGVEIPLCGLGVEQRRLGVTLAREIKTLSPEKAEQLQALLFADENGRDLERNVKNG